MYVYFIILCMNIEYIILQKRISLHRLKVKQLIQPQRNNCETLSRRFLKRNLSFHSRLLSFYITSSASNSESR